MCFGGGGGSSGKITMPSTGAYDGMLRAQMEAMQSQMNGLRSRVRHNSSLLSRNSRPLCVS